MIACLQTGLNIACILVWEHIPLHWKSELFGYGLSFQQCQASVEFCQGIYRP